MADQLSFVQIKDREITIKRLDSDTELADVLTSFAKFLRAAGYEVNGELGVFNVGK